MKKKEKKEDNKRNREKEKKNNSANNKKGTVFSLSVALLLLISSLFLFTTLAITLLNKPTELVEFSNLISYFLADNVSFIAGEVLFLIPVYLTIFIVSIMVFMYRGKKPYSYIKIIIFILFVYSSYLLTLRATNQEFPPIIVQTLLPTSLTSQEVSFRLLISFVAEAVLLIIFNPIIDFLNTRDKKKRVSKKKDKKDKKESKTPIQEKQETDSKKVENVQPIIESDKSDLGIDFPKPIDVPSLSFLEEKDLTYDVGLVNTPRNVEKYGAVKKEVHSAVEDNFVENLHSKETISLETLKLAKKNVEEKMAKLNNPSPIIKPQKTQMEDKESLDFVSVLNQRVENNNQNNNQYLNLPRKKESPAVQAYRDKEAQEARSKVSALFGIKARKSPSVSKKQNEVKPSSSLENVMKGGYLRKATEKYSIKDEVEEVVEKQEKRKQSTSSIIDEINKNISQRKEVIRGDDFSDVDFGNTLNNENVTSSSLSSNGSLIRNQKPLDQNSYARGNYNSTAKAVGDAVLVDEKEEIITTVEEEEDLESAVARLATSHLLDPNKFSYKFPPKSLLNEYPATNLEIDDSVKLQAQLLIETLAQFKYDVELRNIVKGPTVTMFEIVPAPGIKINSITSLRDNIAMNLAAKKVRILAPIPGQTAVGVEIPNIKRDVVGFKEILTNVDHSKMAIPMTMGRTLYGDCKTFDVATSPHMLVAGSTGSGKSVCINSLICSILYTRTPRDVRLIMVDPKVVELTIYNGIPHLLTPVITETKRALKVLDFCIEEMDRRNKMLSKMSVRNIRGYNNKIKENRIAQQKMPYIVLIIDEFATLMSTAGKDLDEKVSRLTAMSRAVGIHLVFATQRPSVDVITGVIKNNLPTRVAFAVTSTQDSRTIIGTSGAEDLLGKGDMLFSANGKAVTRMQGVFLSDEEVEDIVNFAKRQEEPDYIDESYFEDPYDDDVSSIGEEDDEDEYWNEALEIAFDRGNVSASFLQRRLKIGYNRAARLVEDMEAKGIVGPPNGSKPREVLKYQE